MRSVSLRSPAKLNLYLKIVNKRPDGFHNIQTIFQRISLYDDIELESNKTGAIRISCSHPHVPQGSQNLVYKVAKAFQDDFKLKKGANIKIKKRIPVAAGLAGGSSNAATVLKGLNKIWNLHLTQKQLVSYARKIGSDVAFFVHDYSWAFGTQRGDKIKKLNITNKIWATVVVPRIKMYSWKVYGCLKLKSKRPKTFSPGLLGPQIPLKRGPTNVLTKRTDNANILIHHLQKRRLSDVGCFLTNDLEGAIFKLSPSLRKLKERLKLLNHKGVMVSGSGPSVFALSETQKEARKIQSLMLKRFSQVFVVQTL